MTARRRRCFGIRISQSRRGLRKLLRVRCYGGWLASGIEMRRVRSRGRGRVGTAAETTALRRNEELAAAVRDLAETLGECDGGRRTATKEVAVPTKDVLQLVVVDGRVVTRTDQEGCLSKVIDAVSGGDDPVATLALHEGRCVAVRFASVS